MPQNWGNPDLPPYRWYRGQEKGPPRRLPPQRDRRGERGRESEVTIPEEGGGWEGSLQSPGGRPWGKHGNPSGKKKKNLKTQVERWIRTPDPLFSSFCEKKKKTVNGKEGRGETGESVAPVLARTAKKSKKALTAATKLGSPGEKNPHPRGGKEKDGHAVRRREGTEIPNH